MKHGIFRFGAFELDTERVELRKSGIRVRLQEQTFRVLTVLLSARGAVVTRDELRRALWPEDTYVEFNQGLNAAVNKLRETLGDSAANPRFVETVPRRGYRFIAPVEVDLEPPRVVPDAQSVRSVATGVPRRPSISVLAVVLAVAVLVAVALARRNQLAGDPVPKPLTTDPGNEFTPSFSPDADRVAYAWAGPDERGFDIYIKQIGTEQPQRLTTNAGDDVQPVWSPNGRSIAFLRTTGAGPAAIMIVPVGAGAERKIGELHATLSDALGRRLLMWLPDNRGLIVADKVAADTPRALYRVSAVTGEPQQITFPPHHSEGDDGPDLSPDRSKLAFTRETNSFTSELFILPLTPDFAPSGEPQQITQLGQVSSDPVWMANGTDLIFVSGSQFGRRFFRTTASGSSQPRAIFPVTEACRGGVALSRTKNRFAYSRSIWDMNIWHLDLAAPAPRPRPFVNSTYLDHLPVFSRDGTRVAFVTNRSGAQELWVSRADGAGSRMLVSSQEGEVGFADWSPDSRQIAYTAQRAGFKHVFTVSSTGGRPRQVTAGSSNNGEPSWSHDGKWLYFSSDRDGKNRIWRIPAVSDASEPVRISRQGCDRSLVSPDGRYLYYVIGAQHSRLIRLALESGRESELPVEPISNAGNFWVSKTGVYFIAPENANGKAAIRFLPFSSSQPRTIAVTEKSPAWGLSVSPDERSLLFAQLDREENDLMLIEDFR